MANHLFLLTVFTMPQCICCKKYSQLDASPKKHLKDVVMNDLIRN